ncbi:MAG: PspA/IM30 family protein [Gammaproteobacteria bacterium]|nr:PspA/IM30 family protein [Gammaproteobacteria bacterium]
MSIFKKLFTAVRGAATEAGEAIVDSQALRIMDQEIHDAENELKKSKEGLTTVMAQKMATERQVKEKTAAIDEHEGYAVKALDKGDEGLAVEIAEKIAEFSNELEPLKTLLEGQIQSVNNLKQIIKQTEKRLQSTKREVALIKSTQSVQKAQDAIAATHSGSTSAMSSAMDSMQRIKARQQEKSDKMNAALALENEGGDGDLKAKMAAAGITGSGASGNSILEKLKARQAGAA